MAEREKEVIVTDDGGGGGGGMIIARGPAARGARRPVPAVRQRPVSGGDQPTSTPTSRSRRPAKTELARRSPPSQVAQPALARPFVDQRVGGALLGAAGGERRHSASSGRCALVQTVSSNRLKIVRPPAASTVPIAPGRSSAAEILEDGRPRAAARRRAGRAQDDRAHVGEADHRRAWPRPASLRMNGIRVCWSLSMWPWPRKPSSNSDSPWSAVTTIEAVVEHAEPPQPRRAARRSAGRYRRSRSSRCARPSRDWPAPISPRGIGSPGRIRSMPGS